MPLPSRCKSFLAATWALGEGGNGSAARGGAGLPGWGGASRDRVGRGEANCAAGGRRRPRGEAAGAGLRGLLGHRGAGTGQERRERRTRSACGGSWPRSPAAGSPPLYTESSGITTAEGLQARAR